ncbi:bZIP transcription factor 44-like [Andrographis paniculata]|uniref:bZIP transcription factor 44-like n=1 Tax=Andrographis paniculata TaxID=175694 RepID=UPI0021E9A660|nr:bZIP transcription factor 44-like [Andrographis paniculata]
MAYSSGTSSGSPLIQNSGSENTKNMKQVVDQKKRKRMESNRESARRSRMRKQKHMEDLMGQVAQLTEKNKQMLSRINVTTEQTVKVEAENSVLKAQEMELTQRLQSLSEILNIINSSSSMAAAGGGAAGSCCMVEAEEFQSQGFTDSFMNDPWNLMGPNQHPIMASAEMFDY